VDEEIKKVASFQQEKESTAASLEGAKKKGRTVPENKRVWLGKRAKGEEKTVPGAVAARRSQEAVTGGLRFLGERHRLPSGLNASPVTEIRDCTFENLAISKCTSHL
jgi:hypothetical protein